jgi:hypothetical protein
VTGTTIDRPARDQLSRNIRLLVSGKISNDKFEDGIPETDDAAAMAFAGMTWLFHNDMHEHRLVGRYAVEASTRREVIRWVLFLDGDLQYRWPKMYLPGLHPLRRVRPALIRWLNWPNAISPEHAAVFLSAGDRLAWPFISRSEYKIALRNPRRLSGNRNRRPSEAGASA